MRTISSTVLVYRLAFISFMHGLPTVGKSSDAHKMIPLFDVSL